MLHDGGTEEEYLIISKLYVKNAAGWQCSKKYFMYLDNRTEVIPT